MGCKSKAQTDKMTFVSTEDLTRSLVNVLQTSVIADILDKKKINNFSNNFHISRNSKMKTGRRRLLRIYRSYMY